MLYFHKVDWPGALRALRVVCRDEKKEPVLDCYVSGVQSETLLNLVNSSMLLLATNVGAEEGRRIEGAYAL